MVKKWQKGKIFFNIVIIITALALISVVGYVLYYYISNYIDVKQAEEAVAEFENEVLVVAIENEEENQVPQINQEPQSNQNQSQTTTKKTTSKVSYRGYSMIGTIQIPKTKVKIPIVDTVTPQSITAAAAVLYGPGLNKKGNTVIVAHNYRNGTFFSNNKKLRSVILPDFKIRIGEGAFKGCTNLTELVLPSFHNLNIVETECMRTMPAYNKAKPFEDCIHLCKLQSGSIIEEWNKKSYGLWQKN